MATCIVLEISDSVHFRIPSVATVWQENFRVNYILFL